MWWLSVAFAVSPWEATQAVRARDVDTLVRPSSEDRAVLHQLVTDWVREAPTGSLTVPTGGWPLGLSVREDHGVAIVNGPSGWALLALRLGPASPWVVAAPHPWYDLGTGDLTDKLFAESNARAAVFSTAHRALGADTDAAHAVEGTFTTVTLALAEAIEEPVLVQIHGFGNGHTDADVVVGGWGAEPLADQLTSDLGWSTTTGEVVPTLAGRSNVQVRALRGQAPVAHLELSKPLRKQLRKDATLRAALWASLRKWAR